MSGIGKSNQSTSPVSKAAEAVAASGMASHSTRSTFAILPPDVPFGASSRGRYAANRSNTARCPIENSFATKRNGPQPIVSLICVPGSVAASRDGTIGSTFGCALPSTKGSCGNGFLRRNTTVRSSGASNESRRCARVLPLASRFIQRPIEAAQSRARTGSLS